MDSMQQSLKKWTIQSERYTMTDTNLHHTAFSAYQNHPLNLTQNIDQEHKVDVSDVTNALNKY